ncbi:death-associated protein 1 [Galendromus occidentalis]|uniref:Death-associated protein 1 n=1 Tax=Galendromus occidentalis TaxID=34638 RepID=A0AAJ6QXY7_9ACAR|nr:death-associated protein 1 [Galendromus occidentalis]
MPNSAETELKAGHPPADKAGGMRITQHKTEKTVSGSPPPQTNIEVALSNSAVQTQNRQLINGVVAKGDADFPAEAVKAFHENKPLPTHDLRPKNSQQPKFVQQPRKQ